MKYFLFLLAPLLLLLNAGCTSTTTPSTQQLPPPPNIFFNETNLPTGFVALLQTFSPDTLPHAQEIFPPEHIKTPIRMFTFQAIDFANADYPEAKFLPEHSDLKNSSFQLIFYNAYPVGLFQSRTPLGQYGAINQYGYNDYYVLLTSDDNHSEPQKTLYKNFEEIATGVVDYRLNTQNQLYLVKNEGVNDKGQPLNLILTKEGKLLEKMPATSGYVKPLLFDENDQLIYAVSVLDNEEAYANSTYFLKNERGEIIDSWTGNFLVGTETYTLQALETGFAIGRKYDERPNDIEESISTITPEILTEVQQQEKTLMKYYRLIDQQHFEEAYAMLKQPQLSLDAFRKQWNKYNLVDIDRIATPLIFFKSYPSTNTPYLEGIGQLNQFEVRLFMRTLSGTIEINREILRVSPSGIELLASEPMPIFHTLNTPKMLLVQLYYHLIASERFEEAYQMQYRHSQSLQAFQDTYKNVQGIAIHQMTDMRTLSKEDWESSSTDDKEEGEVQLLIDFITPKGNERYAIQKEVLNGKIKHLSSEATTKGCVFVCGYGYKPVIYLYPPQPTEIKVGLYLKGQLTVAYPDISETNNRTVLAHPDGTLVNKADGKEYSYLFREGTMPDPRTITEGFVVKNKDTVAFLQDTLAYLGLTPREYNEFIVYRRPLMKRNPRNLISFMGEAYTKQAPLTITPTPDSIQRVFMVFQGLKEPIEIKQQLLKPFQRTGFAVIERGGSEL